ncbi:MAG: hypothetical protein WBA97_16940, partial [Actinophytocola sp.]|uniref:hypothetical protein n=1 Tax=Actinophytocola sp. TaxID=1872138 RepID=UPI003C777836
MDTPERPSAPDQAPVDEPIELDQLVAIVPDVPYEPAVEPFTYAQPEPPKPAGPPKSVSGAALLNLTGLGLGYAYLRNRVLLIGTLVVTAGMITVAFLTDAATQPGLWRAAALAWLVLPAAHAAFLASRRAPG